MVASCWQSFEIERAPFSTNDLSVHHQHGGDGVTKWTQDPAAALQGTDISPSKRRETGTEPRTQTGPSNEEQKTYR